MMDADDLALLDVIISEGGITAAARKLGQPKTTVSRRLRGLETAAGVQLFERSGRKLRLTRVGEAFAAPARDIRAALAAAQALVRVNASHDAGHVRISAPMLFGRKVLVPFTGQFLAQRPGASAALIFDQTAVDPLRGRIDMAFSISRPKADYLTIQKIADIDIALFAAPSLAVQVKSAEDLRRLPAVLTSNTEAAELTLDLTDGHRSETVSLKVRTTVNDPEAAAEFISCGLGIGGLPGFVAQDLVAAGKLIRVLPGVTIGKVAIYVATPPLGNLIPIVKSFLADLRTEIRRTSFGRVT